MAIDITLQFDDVNSERPSIDPNASALTELMQFSKSFYEDVFEDEHALTITYAYASLPGSPIGLYLPSGPGPDLRDSGGTLLIDSAVDWFLDPTPENNSEFDMEQTFWRDLTTTQRVSWYNDYASSTIPETFEAGYTGVAIDSDAMGKFDLLTVVLHELGHGLGFSGTPPTIIEAADGDIDYSPDFLFGQTLSAESASVANDDGINIWHLESDYALMSPSGPRGMRSLPSHTDLFAMAGVNGYTYLDVPRREFYGNSNWHNSRNWSGNAVPGSLDDVYVRIGTLNASLIDSDGVARNLYVSESANVDTNANRLRVSGEVIVKDDGSDIFINSGGELDAGFVWVQDGADVQMSGGTLDVDRIRIDAGARLLGSDSDITVDVALLLENDGTIWARNGVVMTFDSTRTAPWDLDGSGGGVLDANSGTLIFASGAPYQEFNGTMIAGAAQAIVFSSPLSIGTGTVELNGGDDFSPARIDGDIASSDGSFQTAGVTRLNGQFTMSRGRFDIDADGIHRFSSTKLTRIEGGDFHLQSNAEISFPGPTEFTGSPTFFLAGPLLDDGFVNLDGPTTYDGATVTIGGAAVQNGNATVSAASTINASFFDLDGATEANHMWTLNANLTVNADKVGQTISFVPNVYLGTIIVNNAKLTVNLSDDDDVWVVANTMNFVGRTGGGSNNLDGNDLGLGIDSNVDVTHNVRWHARTIMAGQININAASSLSLRGGDATLPNVLFGGTINGPGALSSAGNIRLHGHGTINAPIEFLDNSQLRADGGTLTINGPILEAGTIGTATAEGVLEVTSSWNTNVAGELNLQGGEITGASITNGTIANPGRIAGFGKLSPQQLQNDGTIAAVGGMLLIDTVQNVRLGNSFSAVVSAIDGDVRVVDALASGFLGTVDVGPSRSITFEQGWYFEGGRLNLLGGATLSEAATVAGDTQIIGAAVDVERFGSFHLHTTFNSNAVVRLPNAIDQLSLTHGADVFPLATLVGEGSLTNAFGSTITAYGMTNMSVGLYNSGVLDLEGATIQSAVVNSRFGVVTGFGTIDSPNDASRPLVNDGAIRADSEQRIELRGYVTGVGSLERVLISGTDSPGPGTAKVNRGDVQYTGTLQIEIQGTAPGSGYDQLLHSRGSGVAELGGILELHLMDGFTPARADIFEILSATSLLGAFDNVADGSRLDAIHGNGSFLVSYGAGSGAIILSDFRPPLGHGDLNLDGRVDRRDAALFVRKFGLTGATDVTDGDLDHDGKTGLVDLMILQHHLGYISESPAASGSAVPEPATILLILTGVVCFAARRRR